MKEPLQFGFRTPEYKQFPPVVQVALVTGICPSHCAYCPVGTGSLHLEPLFFSFDLWRKVALEVAAYPWATLRIHSRGEPMSHVDYVPMIAFAKKAGVRTVTSFTNGIYLHRHVEALLDAGIDLLEISADAADPVHYLEWRRNPHFEQVTEGVRRVFEARNRRPGCPTRVVVSAVDHPDFGPHREAFTRFWGPICDKVLVRPFHTYGGLICDPYQRQKSKDQYIPCVQLWERFSINSEGRVNACFNDWSDAEVVGDLREPGASVSAIWQSGTFQHIRQESLSGPCVKCCFTCSGPALSSWGGEGYQHWVRELLDRPCTARGNL